MPLFNLKKAYLKIVSIDSAYDNGRALEREGTLKYPKWGSVGGPGPHIIIKYI